MPATLESQEKALRIEGDIEYRPRAAGIVDRPVHVSGDPEPRQLGSVDTELAGRPGRQCISRRNKTGYRQGTLYQQRFCRHIAPLNLQCGDSRPANQIAYAEQWERLLVDEYD